MEKALKKYSTTEKMCYLFPCTGSIMANSSLTFLIHRAAISELGRAVGITSTFVGIYRKSRRATPTLESRAVATNSIMTHLIK